MSEKKVRAAIVGTGSSMPERILTNDDLEKIVDTSDEWIFTRTGIRERRIAADGETTSTFGAEAARRALDAAGLKPEDITLIITATLSPDFPFPSTSALIQHKIGAKNAGGFDLEAACAGFVYAKIMAARMIEADPSQTILVIGSEILSRYTDYTDRTSCILFGDGAGAAILKASTDGNGVLSSQFGVDGSGAEFMRLEAGGSANPASEQTVRERQHYMKVRGRETFRFAVKIMADLVRDTLAMSDLTLDDLKLIVPHQVNMRILDAAAQRLNLPREKMFCNIERYGNTSAASVPIALDEAVRTGAIERGDIVVFVAFGGGLSWASSVVRW